MADKIKLTLQHEDFPNLVGTNTVETFVEIDGKFPVELEDLIECVREEFENGLKGAAGGHLIDYDSFGSDSAYLDRIDQVIKEITVVDVAVPGAKAEEQFAAVLAAVRAQSAETKTVDPVGRRVQKTGPEKFEDLLDEMYEFDLDELSEPTSPGL